MSKRMINESCLQIHLITYRSGVVMFDDLLNFPNPPTLQTCWIASSIQNWIWNRAIDLIFKLLIITLPLPPIQICTVTPHDSVCTFSSPPGSPSSFRPTNLHKMRCDPMAELRCKIDSGVNLAKSPFGGITVQNELGGGYYWELPVNSCFSSSHQSSCWWVRPGFL